MFRAAKVMSKLVPMAVAENVSITRSLYSVASLGIDTYVGAREKVQSYLVDNGEKFRGKMSEFLLDDNSRNMIFTEDLKNMIHIVEKTPADLDLVVKMIKKFNAQNKEVRFGNFIFGPVVMRMFHYLKEDELALQCFKNAEMDGFFDQLSSYQILVDMLYEHGRYQDVRDVFNIIKSRQIQGGMYPKHVIVVVFAACYKENSAASFEYSTKLWKELNEVGHIPMRKTTTFAAALALAQNAPHIALEIVGTVRQQNYVTVRNIKVAALAQLGRADDALPVLRSVLEVHDPSQNKHTFTKDVFDLVKAEILKGGDKEVIQNFTRVEAFLNDNGHITDNTLNDLLCTEIVSTAQNGFRKDRGVLAASYSTNDRYSNQQNNHNSKYNYGQNNNYNRNSSSNNMTRRPGLKELY